MPETETNPEKLYRLATQFTYLTLSNSVSHYTKDAFEALISIAEREERDGAGLDKAENSEGSDGIIKFRDAVWAAGNRLVDQAHALDTRAVKLDSGLEDELVQAIADNPMASSLIDMSIDDASVTRALTYIVKEGTELWKVQDGILGKLTLQFYADTKKAYDAFVEHVTELASKVESGSGSINHALGIIKNFYEGIRDITYKATGERCEDPVYDTSVKNERAKKALKILAVTGDKVVVRLLGHDEVLGDGYEIDHTPSFEAGKTMLDAGYDLVLSRIGRDSSGATPDKAYAFIKDAAKYGTPVVVMSGSGAVTKEEVLAQGAKGLLNVPFDVSEAAKLVKRAIAENVPYFV